MGAVFPFHFGQMVHLRKKVKETPRKEFKISNFDYSMLPESYEESESFFSVPQAENVAIETCAGYHR